MNFFIEMFRIFWWTLLSGILPNDIYIYIYIKLVEEEAILNTVNLLHTRCIKSCWSFATVMRVVHTTSSYKLKRLAVQCRYRRVKLRSITMQKKFMVCNWLGEISFFSLLNNDYLLYFLCKITLLNSIRSRLEQYWNLFEHEFSGLLNKFS